MDVVFHPGDVFSSPCLVGDDMILVLGSMNKIIYAIEGKSGNILWMFETGGEVWSSPSYNGNEIFIGSDDGFFYCLDLDGKLFWKTKLNGKIRSSSPLVDLFYIIVFVCAWNLHSSFLTALSILLICLSTHLLV
jgi:outer membrane protein assembly factor BamB